MSNEQSNFYFNNPFQDNQYGNNTSGFSFSSNSPTQEFEYPKSSYTSFTECLQGSYSEYNAFELAVDLSPPSSETLLTDKDEGKLIGGGEISFTPNSSVLSSLSEGGGEDSEKGKKDISEKELDDGEDSSKKEINKSKKKGTKKEREPRFAFMTKSDVDHLEDGYRWRKYGQKAVKNSPFPRSYYRCTTQKCFVKKHVERSYQDPSIVMTTYEGQHSHPIPAIVKGHMAGMVPASMLARAPQTSIYNNYNHGGMAMSSFYPQYNPTTLTSQQQLQFNDYGLLQDMVHSSMFFKQ